MKHIKCKTKEQMRKVLKKLENDGYRWASGTKPTEYVPFGSYKEDTVIEVDDERRDLAYASYGYFVDTQRVKAFIDAEDFVRDEKNRPSIVIFRRGREVIAKDVATGNKGIAKCSPDDEFVFKTGASIALARLMAKTPDVLNHDVKDEWIKVLGLTPVKKRAYTDADRNFKVGDRVVVRDWDDMVKEYGVNSLGRIAKDSLFVDGMKHLCGRTATVTRVADGLGFKKVEVDFDDKSGITSWTFNPWMFNPTDVQASEKEKPEAEFKVGDYVTLKEGIEADERYGGLRLLPGAMYDSAHHKRMEVVTAKWEEEVNTYFYECKGDGRYTFHYSEEMLDKWDESKIHEGDTVRVVNTGLDYTSYVKWVGEHISDPYMAARFCFGSPSTDKNYKVIKIAEHEKNYRPLAYIEEIDGHAYNRCYLIEVKGLEKA